ncbi:MAG TPA: aminoglycoside phosphotransferase family protein [Candidatus Nanoarchaeia archaeon]|nr:aminoglycoside phosphotransferase family protein [Candidatus Nanoarchaeia archaeon]
MIKKELIQKIKKDFPKLKVSNSKFVTCGFDHLILILDDKYIFRFPRGEKYKKRIRKEIAFLKIFKKITPIPVPNYSFISKETNFGGYKLIKGKEFSTSIFRKLIKEQKVSTSKDISLFLSALHTFSLEEAKKLGFRRVEWGIKKMGIQFKKRKNVIFSVLSQKEKKIVLKIYKEFLELPQFPQKVLTHNDLSDDHIFINNGKIVGIIDFADASLGDPALDFSWFWNLGKKAINEIYAKYSGPKDTDFLKRSKYYYIFHFTLGYIYHGIERKDKMLLREGLRNINKIMKAKEDF